MAMAAMIAMVAFSDSPAAQSPRSPLPPLVIASMAGNDLYDFYCASCHGRDGKGAGPTAPALSVPPTDLTLLARHDGGTFPRQRLEDYITGVRATAAHGSADMPVWGPIFRALDPKDAANKVRIRNIVDYIERLQARP